MFNLLKQKRGQASLGEYVVVLFIVIGAAIGISTYLQRGLQARMRDANLYMVDTVSNAHGNTINYQYEPYYASVSALVDRRQDKNSRLFGSGVGSTGIFQSTVNESSQAATLSGQAPPRDAD